MRNFCSEAVLLNSYVIITCPCVFRKLLLEISDSFSVYLVLSSCIKYLYRFFLYSEPKQAPFFMYSGSNSIHTKLFSHQIPLSPNFGIWMTYFYA